jgi:hypothetical protein
VKNGGESAAIVRRNGGAVRERVRERAADLAAPTNHNKLQSRACRAGLDSKWFPIAITSSNPTARAYRADLCCVCKFAEFFEPKNCVF